MHFITNARGWAFGARERSGHTGGQTWSGQTSNTGAWLEDVHFTSEQHGVAVGSHGTILRTQDGGASWELIKANLREWLYSVAFADAQRGYAVGEKGIILRTDDGGAKWSDQESGINVNLFEVGVAGRNDALVSGDQGRVLRTMDGVSNGNCSRTHQHPLFSVATLRQDAWAPDAARDPAPHRRCPDVKFRAPNSRPILAARPHSRRAG